MNNIDEIAMQNLGSRIAAALKGGEVIELVGDVGAGKTTLTKAIARQLGITEPIQSPTFTISRTYNTPSGLILQHYDFYRLGEAGVMGDEIYEASAQQDAVTVIEWAGAVANALPDDRLTITLQVVNDTERQVSFEAHGPMSKELLERIG